MPRPVIPFAAALAAAGLAVAAAPAAGQTLSYEFSPPYQEGQSGANGWFNRAVQVRYRCEGGEVLECPERPVQSPERFGNNTGVGGPVVRTALFATGPVSVTLEIAPGVPFRVDTADPPLPVATTPAPPGDDDVRPVYDAGSDVRADFRCDFGGDASGPSPQAPCTAVLDRRALQVANGDRLDTGVPDQPSTWGTRTLRVVSTDAAGNQSVRRVSYDVDELPGAPVVVAPAAGEAVGRRPVLRWNAPTDDGSGFAVYRVRLATTSGPRVYEVADRAPSVSFTVPDDLPTGAASWSVTFADVRGRTGASPARPMTVVDRPPPGAPRVTTAPVTTTETRPLFAWQAAEAGGAFEWQIVTGGRIAQQGTTTGLSVRPPDALDVGPHVFRIRQIGVSGVVGPWSADAGFSVVAPPAVAAVPPPSTPAAQPRAVITRFVPATSNAARLRPRAGARVTVRPVITWPRVRRATLYNLQIFRVQGRTFVKILSVFPRTTRYRVPPRKLTPGTRYVFRIWPYDGLRRRYSTTPLGTSWFDVRPAARR